MHQKLPLRSILGGPCPSQLEGCWELKFPWFARVSSSSAESIVVGSWG